MRQDAVIKSYFGRDKQFISKHQIDSYDNFLFDYVPSAIQDLNPIVVSEGIELNVNSIEYEKSCGADGKPVPPAMCRTENLTYKVDIYANIDLIKKKKGGTYKTETYERIRLGSIPTMLHSSACYLRDKSSEALNDIGECQYDQGGYFIVDGKEKVLISRERMIPNKLFTSYPSSDDADYVLKGECRSVAEAGFPKVLSMMIMRGDSRQKYEAEANEEMDESNALLRRAATMKEKTIRKHLVVNIKSLSTEDSFPVFTVFRALGIESDHDIVDLILNSSERDNDKCIEHVRKMAVASEVYTQKQALDILSNSSGIKSAFKNKHEYVKSVLYDDFIPNMKSYKTKAILLGRLVNTMIKTEVGLLPVTNRDSFRHKRVDVCGVLMSEVFRDQYNRFRNSVIRKLQLKGDIDDNQRFIFRNEEKYVFSSRYIDEGFRASFKGNWGMLNDSSKDGIVQDLNRLSYMGYVSHVRRVMTPVDSALKIVGPHRLGSEQFGYLCPFESPDGGNVGLIKHMSASCEITKEQSAENIIEVLEQDVDFKNIEDINNSMLHDHYMVYLNHNIIGVHRTPFELHKILTNKKKIHVIDYQVTLILDVASRQYHINTDAGRCIRPLYLASAVEEIKDLTKISDWYGKDFLGKYIEYVELEESNHLLIAMKPEQLTSNKNYTHCEIHPSLSLSLYTNTIPFVNHNQGPRVVFSGQQGKQAVGVYATNFNSRIDTMGYILHYPQKNLVSTRISEYVNKNKLPNGENLIVAIATYTGYNQEDSIIINKDSVDRGMFNVSYFKSVIDSEISTGDVDSLTVKFKNVGNHDTLDSNGLPKINKYVKEGEALLGKVEQKESLYSDKQNILYESSIQTKVTDRTLKSDKTKTGIVDDIHLYDKGGDKHVKIRLRKNRRPVLGDKLASMHGQKGVIGFILPQVDMPFTKDGLVPDIIINPHAIPSRMTIGQLLECILSRAACSIGKQVLASPFEPRDENEAYFQHLENNGYDRYSNEIMYNARTGEQMKTEIFIGPTYYYRLKHMVEDKINYRGRGGAIDFLTRQPVKGRANNGGLRIGEMETNAIASHGLSAFMKESMMDRSDGIVSAGNIIKKSAIHADEDGDEIISNQERKFFRSYDQNKFIMENNRYEVPQAFQLLKKELASMSIKMQLLPKIDSETYEDDEEPH
tara:strand:+ start:573 stop:4067 length:3495 start_codon:yes stop_codon:yes gene_type:complete